MTVDKAKADTQAEATLQRLYRLTGGDGTDPRVRSMSRVEAKALNSARGDGRKWLLDPAAEPGEITDYKPTNGETFSKTVAASVHAQKLANLTDAQEIVMKKRSKNDGKSESGREWRGLSMCQIIRACGHRGMKLPEAQKVLNDVGLHPAKGTLTIQLGKGRKDRASVPELSNDQTRELFGDVKPPAGDAPKLSKAERRAARKAKAERKAKRLAKAGAGATEAEVTA